MRKNKHKRLDGISDIDADTNRSNQTIIKPFSSTVSQKEFIVKDIDNIVQITMEANSGNIECKELDITDLLTTDRDNSKIIISQDIDVTGTLTVSGAITAEFSSTEDNLIEFNKNGGATSNDIGVYGPSTSSTDGVAMFYDKSGDRFRFLNSFDMTSHPVATINLTGATYGDLQINDLYSNKIFLTGSITDNTQATTKSYVDSEITTAIASVPTNYLETTGGTLTGDVSFSGNNLTSVGLIQGNGRLDLVEETSSLDSPCFIELRDKLTLAGGTIEFRPNSTNGSFGSVLTSINTSGLLTSNGGFSTSSNISCNNLTSTTSISSATVINTNIQPTLLLDHESGLSTILMSGTTNTDVSLRFARSGDSVSPNVPGRSGALFSSFNTSHYFLDNNASTFRISYSSENDTNPPLSSFTERMAINSSGETIFSGPVSQENQWISWEGYWRTVNGTLTASTWQNFTKTGSGGVFSIDFDTVVSNDVTFSSGQFTPALSGNWEVVVRVNGYSVNTDGATVGYLEMRTASGTQIQEVRCPIPADDISYGLNMHTIKSLTGGTAYEFRIQYSKNYVASFSDCSGSIFMRRV